jgi:hypothetical protein
MGQDYNIAFRPRASFFCDSGNGASADICEDFEENVTCTSLSTSPTVNGSPDCTDTTSPLGDSYHALLPETGAANDEIIWSYTECTTADTACEIRFHARWNPDEVSNNTETLVRFESSGGFECSFQMNNSGGAPADTLQTRCRGPNNGTQQSGDFTGTEFYGALIFDPTNHDCTCEMDASGWGSPSISVTVDDPSGSDNVVTINVLDGAAFNSDIYIDNIHVIDTGF